MSEGEVAQGSLASQEKDGGVGPAEQGVPGRGVWSYLLQSQAGHNMCIGTFNILILFCHKSKQGI